MVRKFLVHIFLVNIFLEKFRGKFRKLRRLIFRVIIVTGDVIIENLLIGMNLSIMDWCPSLVALLRIFYDFTFERASRGPQKVGYVLDRTMIDVMGYSIQR